MFEWGTPNTSFEPMSHKFIRLQVTSYRVRLGVMQESRVLETRIRVTRVFVRRDASLEGTGYGVFVSSSETRGFRSF